MKKRGLMTSQRRASPTSWEANGRTYALTGQMLLTGERGNSSVTYHWPVTSQISLAPGPHLAERPDEAQASSVLAIASASEQAAQTLGPGPNANMCFSFFNPKMDQQQLLAPWRLPSPTHLLPPLHPLTPAPLTLLAWLSGLVVNETLHFSCSLRSPF